MSSGIKVFSKALTNTTFAKIALPLNLTAVIFNLWPSGLYHNYFKLTLPKDFTEKGNTSKMFIKSEVFILLSMMLKWQRCVELCTGWFFVKVVKNTTQLIRSTYSNNDFAGVLSAKLILVIKSCPQKCAVISSYCLAASIKVQFTTLLCCAKWKSLHLIEMFTVHLGFQMKKKNNCCATFNTSLH